MKKYYIKTLFSLVCLMGNYQLSNAQLYIDGGTLYVQNNAVVKVETNLVTAKPSSIDPKIINWGTIAVTGNTDFHADTDYDGQGVLRLLGTSQQTLSGNGIPLKKVDIQNSNNVVLGENVYIQSELNLTSGYLICGNYNLTIDDSVNITGGSSSSYIRINGTGKVKTTVGISARTIPIGRNPYLPVTIEDGGGEEYTIGIVDNVYANPETNTTIQNSDVVSETWSIQASGSVSNVTIGIQWEASEETSGFNRASSYLAFWEDGVSSSWDEGTAQSASGVGPYSLNRTINMSNKLYYFGVGGSGSALPIELTYLTAQWQEIGKTALLNWQTQAEENNSHFEIERSFNGITFEKIGQIEGNGTSLSIHDYQFTDKQLDALNYETETVFYRLKQVDFNGDFAYSPTKTLSLDPSVSYSVSAWPNPTSNWVNVEANTAIQLLSVYDAQGRLVKQVEALNKINLENFDKGIYILEIKTNNTLQFERIVLQ